MINGNAVVVCCCALFHCSSSYRFTFRSTWHREWGHEWIILNYHGYWPGTWLYASLFVCLYLSVLLSLLPSRSLCVCEVNRKMAFVCLFTLLQFDWYAIKQYRNRHHLQTNCILLKIGTISFRAIATWCGESFPFRNVCTKSIIFLIKNSEWKTKRRRRHFINPTGNWIINSTQRQFTIAVFTIAFIEFDSFQKMCTIEYWRLIRETMMTYYDCYAGPTQKKKMRHQKMKQQFGNCT